MKILFVSHRFPPFTKGGAEISTALLAKQLSLRHDCTVLTARWQNKPWLWHGIRVLPLLEDLNVDKLGVLGYGVGLVNLQTKNIQTLKRVVAEEKIDLVQIVPTTPSFVSLSRGAISTGKPTIIDARDYTLICPTSYHTRSQPGRCSLGCLSCLVRRYLPRGLLTPLHPIFALYELTVYKYHRMRLRRAVRTSTITRIVALSKYVAGELARAGYAKNKLRVIPNMSLPPIKRASASGHRDRTIIFAGVLEPSKGVWDAVFAFEKLQQAGEKKARLLIAGSGSEEQALREYCKKRKLNVTFLGRVPFEQVQKVYARGKIIIAPSTWPEPFGRFIQESVTARTPIVAANSGGIPEGVHNNVNGLLVKPGDVDGFVVALHTLLTDKKLWRRMQWAQAEQAARYDPIAVTAQRLRLYSEVLPV